jgi:hypothetical protein
VRNLITAELAVVEMSAKAMSGKASPTPKKRNFVILPRKSALRRERVNIVAMNKGLHGITIAPKKKPFINPLARGFLTIGTRILGRSFPTSIFTRSSKLITINIPKAIGDTTSITLVSDTCRTVVNKRPSSNINRITPEVIIRPNRAMVMRRDSLLVDS